MGVNKIKYTELFGPSFQGEGKWAGSSSVFLRLWSCNLQCSGFGQDEPLKPETWDLSFRNYDPKEHEVTSYDQLPIFGKGCDSVYSWCSKYKHMAMEDTARDLAYKIMEKVKGRWNNTHLVITGGESLLPANQKAFISIMKELRDWPNFITFETNGTQELTDEMKDFLLELVDEHVDVSFSVSVKLRNVTGEFHQKTMKPEYVGQYQEYISDYRNIWLKPVVCDTEKCWTELAYVVDLFGQHVSDMAVYVMPVGATVEQQNDPSVRRIVEKALDLGHHVSLRTHVWVFGNETGY